MGWYYLEVNKEMLKGYLESIILSVLKNEDLYGYDISKRIRAISNDTFEIKEGTLYVILKRLENNKYIKSYWDDTESGGGRRRYHHITSEGLKYLNDKEREWRFFENIINKFLRSVDK